MAEGGPSSSSTVSSFGASNDYVNEIFLQNLVEMGIHRDDARQALKMVNNRSLEDALAVVFGETPSYSMGTSNNGASVEQATQVNYESSVKPIEITPSDPEMMTYKMLFIVNGSLSMSSGKMAAQVAHCAVDLYQRILNQRMMGLNFWNISGQRKIVVRANSTEELQELESRASTNKSIVTAMIQDAGLTEIPSGSITCVGLFGTNSQIDPIAGHLKLMNDCLKCTATNNQQQKPEKTKHESKASTASKPTTTTTTNPDETA